LHHAGKLHRDIKPPNVLVTPTERVVLLDFGQIAELNAAAAEAASELAGTLAYMSPEQSSCLPLTPASDWYAVGVMLYEALTGQFPFSGSRLDVICAKNSREPVMPAALLPTLPPHLVNLCADLLRQQPGARPT